MSDTPRPHDDDRRLIDDLLDDALGGGRAASPSAAEELIARLERDPAACDYLVERAVLHSRLRQSLRRRSLAKWAMSQAQTDIAPAAETAIDGGTHPRRLYRGWPAWLAAAACLTVIVAGWQLWSRPYAPVTVGIGLAGLATGRAMRGESHELTAGVLELKTRRGAELVI